MAFCVRTGWRYAFLLNCARRASTPNSKPALPSFPESKSLFENVSEARISLTRSYSLARSRLNLFDGSFDVIKKVRRLQYINLD